MLYMLTSSSDDVTAVISDIYLMVGAEVKAAVSVGVTAEAQLFCSFTTLLFTVRFWMVRTPEVSSSIVHREILDVTNARGKFLNCSP
ncbi:MAG: hypothetical protein ACK53Y_24010 [bacterium]